MITQNSPWQPVGSHVHELGEGLRLIDGVLHWVDLLRGELYCWVRGSGTAPVVTHQLDRPLGMVERAASGRLIAAAGTGVIEIGAGGMAVPIADTGLDPSRFRVNDGAIAPDGSFWFGTMVHDGSAPEGAVWRWDAVTSEVTCVVSGIDIPNGPAFLPDGESVLIADSAGGRILRSRVTAPDELEVFATVEDGSPDGMHVDARGRIWSAVWGGARLDVFSSDGVRRATVPLPVAQATSVLLIPAADPLVVVTSATIGLSGAGPLDGRTIVSRLSRLLPD